MQAAGGADNENDAPSWPPAHTPLTGIYPFLLRFLLVLRYSDNEMRQAGGLTGGCP